MKLSIQSRRGIGFLFTACIILALVMVVAGCGPRYTPPSYIPTQPPSSTEEETSPPQPTPTVVADFEADFQLGTYMYKKFPLQLETGDKFSGHLTVRKDLTAELRIEDAKGKNHAPSQSVQYWEWDNTVTSAEAGKWVIYVENKDWLGTIDVTLSYKVVRLQ